MATAIKQEKQVIVGASSGAIIAGNLAPAVYSYFVT
jgi:hypothetical protein